LGYGPQKKPVATSFNRAEVKQWNDNNMNNAVEIQKFADSKARANQMMLDAISENLRLSLEDSAIFRETVLLQDPKVLLKVIEDHLFNDASPSQHVL
jgi:hypothetical protein